MSPAIVYDVVNLFMAAGQPTPRGIDRVDLAYARHFFQNWPGDCEALVPTPWGLRLFPREHVLRGLDCLEALWHEDLPPEQDPAYNAVLAFLTGQPVPPLPPPAGTSWRDTAKGIARILAATGLAFGRSVVRDTKQGAVYLNIGQLGWAAPYTTAWLRRRKDVRPIFMLHDAIPIDHPEFVSPAGQRLHRKMTRVISEHAAGLIFSTQAAAASGLASLSLEGRPAPRVQIAPLPIAPAFLEPQPTDVPLAGARPYFIVCGAIEPRKNHEVLLKAWEHLAETAAPPALVIVGSPGTKGEPILHRLQTSRLFREHMIVVNGLGTRGLRRLVRNARALLMPSKAEGFGLPVVEALALGTPVIAADIPALREAGGENALYVPAVDKCAWAQAIADYYHSTRTITLKELFITNTCFNYVSRLINY